MLCALCQDQAVAFSWQGVLMQQLPPAGVVALWRWPAKLVRTAEVPPRARVEVADLPTLCMQPVPFRGWSCMSSCGHPGCARHTFHRKFAVDRSNLYTSKFQIARVWVLPEVLQVLLPALASRTPVCRPSASKKVDSLLPRRLKGGSFSLGHVCGRFPVHAKPP